jgi:hypothetical protein
VAEFRLSVFNVACKHCGALHFAEEQVQDPRKKVSFNDCCGHGRIFLEQPPPYPWQDFFLNENFPQRKNFFNDIRKINSSFATLSTLQYKFTSPGPPCFRISGQVYHCFNKTAIPNPGQQPTNGQLFFVDREDRACECCCA